MNDESRLVEGWEVSPKRVKAMLDADEAFVLIDCREQPEFDAARIEQAKLYPMSMLKSQLPELEAHAEEKLVVFCHAGMRSMQVTAFLREQGFDDVWSMAGGIDAWSVQIDVSVPRY